MPPILGAKSEEGQSRGRLNLEPACAVLAPTRPTAGLPQVSSHRHKHAKRCSRSTVAAARPGPEGARVMVRRDHTLDKDANAQTQQGEKGEKGCGHFQTQCGRPATAWGPRLRGGQTTPTAVG